MCTSNDWPTHGADSEYVTRPYRVYLVHLYEDRRRWVTIGGCIGPNDARNHAREEYPEWAAVEIREAVA